MNDSASQVSLNYNPIKKIYVFHDAELYKQFTCLMCYRMSCILDLNDYFLKIRFSLNILEKWI